MQGLKEIKVFIFTKLFQNLYLLFRLTRNLAGYQYGISSSKPLNRFIHHFLHDDRSRLVRTVDEAGYNSHGSVNTQICQGSNECVVQCLRYLIVDCSSTSRGILPAFLSS